MAKESTRGAWDGRSLRWVELEMGGLLFLINIAETMSWIILYFQPLHSPNPGRFESNVAMIRHRLGSKSIPKISLYGFLLVQRAALDTWHHHRRLTFPADKGTERVTWNLLLLANTLNPTSPQSFQHSHARQQSGYNANSGSVGEASCVALMMIIRFTSWAFTHQHFIISRRQHEVPIAVTRQLGGSRVHVSCVTALVSLPVGSLDTCRI